ncbi:2Fe-2S iron-sulfur cluster-binding protein [Lentzea sp. NPDC051213]|uniref:2Fe-2S iron-sulfur cluster-binding protein n=1 Tax=Lentzea sp. NPDC051213 TaxID=3364126 RepID=UPI0037A38D66
MTEPGAAEGTSERVHHRLRVAEVITETVDAVSVVFDLTASQRERFAYRPGQFLTLRLPMPQGPVARCYSLASSPHTDPLLKITVKRVDGGAGSNWICDNVRPGTELDVLEPSGVFVPGSLDDDLLLLAAGSGVTPIMSIAKSVLDAGTGTVVLCYANRDESATIFREELETLAAAHQERLTVSHWLESSRGLPTHEGIAELVSGCRFGEAFLCGPKPFMDIARAVLRDLGLPRSKVHLERFSSLSGDPFANTVPAEPTGAAVDLVVELDGEQHRLAWPSKVRLLDVLAAHGLNAPTSCGEGVCASCECRLVAGEVHMVNNQVLDDEDIADGYVLACQALPVTETVHVRF